MPDLLKIGSTYIYIPYLFYIFAILLTLLTSTWLVKKHKFKLNKKASDLVLEYWIIFIVVWKLSYFIYHPKDIVNFLSSFIYFNGESLGIVLGFITVISYSFLLYYKKYIKIDFQIPLIIHSALIFISIERLTKFIYLTDIFILFEGLTYLFIASLFIFSSNIERILVQLRFLRWALIIWVLFRILLKEIDIYFVWLLGILFASVILLFIEWNDPERRINK